MGCFRQPNGEVIRYSSSGRLMPGADGMGLGTAGIDAWNVADTGRSVNVGLGITG
ncbi:hypothetical protein FM107_03230 [Sphingobacterium sp. JB170]|nr:hypothetical protein FM107_03230 [Sphingobacterium sp. JB170]